MVVLSNVFIELIFKLMKLTISDIMLYFGCARSTAFNYVGVIRDCLDIPKHVKLNMYHLAKYECIPLIELAQIFDVLKDDCFKGLRS